MRIYIYETFSSLADGSAMLRDIASHLEKGDDDGYPDWDVELEPHEIEALPVEKPEPDMPSRM